MMANFLKLRNKCS